MGNLWIPEPGYYLALPKFKSCSSSWLWQKHKQAKTWSWMRLNLIFAVRNIHMETLETLTKSNSMCGSTEFKDDTHLKMITNTIPTSMRIVISCKIRSGNTFWVWRKGNGNWDNNMIKTSYGKKTTVEKILASEETNKSNEQGCESQRQWFK